MELRGFANLESAHRNGGFAQSKLNPFPPCEMSLYPVKKYKNRVKKLLLFHSVCAIMKITSYRKVRLLWKSCTDIHAVKPICATTSLHRKPMTQRKNILSSSHFMAQGLSETTRKRSFPICRTSAIKNSHPTRSCSIRIHALRFGAPRSVA